MAGDVTIIVAQAETEHGTETTVVTEEHAATTEGHEVAAEEHGTGVFPPFDPSTFASQLLWLAITFGVLYLIISRAAVPRIGSILEQRKTRIEGDLKEADRLRVETEKAHADYEQALAEARQRAHAIAEETRQSIRTDIDGKRAAVEADLSRKVAEAEASIQASKAVALRSVDGIAADTAAELVQRLTGDVSKADIDAAVAAAARS
jgi:F-type H+-transporting ATPase subunit b